MYCLERFQYMSIYTWPSASDAMACNVAFASVGSSGAAANEMSNQKTPIYKKTRARFAPPSQEPPQNALAQEKQNALNEENSLEKVNSRAQEHYRAQKHYRQTS